MENQQVCDRTETRVQVFGIAVPFTPYSCFMGLVSVIALQKTTGSTVRSLSLEDSNAVTASPHKERYQGTNLLLSLYCLKCCV